MRRLTALACAALSVALSSATGPERAVHHVTPDSPVTLVRFDAPPADTSALARLTVELRARFAGRGDRYRLTLLRMPDGAELYAEADGAACARRDVIDEFKGTSSVLVRLGLSRCGRDSVLASREFESSARFLRDDHTLRATADAARGLVSVTFGRRFLTDTLSAPFMPDRLDGSGIRLAADDSLVVCQLFAEHLPAVPLPVIAPVEVARAVRPAVLDPASAPHPVVGLWSYQGRANEPRRARSGGRYLLAVIPSERTEPGYELYDIVYLDGAEVNSRAWRPGMVKGRLRRGLFANSMELVWHDARMRPATDEARATMPSGDILDLLFADLGATLTFGRVPREAALQVIATLSAGSADCR